MDDMAAAYSGWIEETVGGGINLRDGKWPESVAVGSEAFVTATRETLGARGEGRTASGGDGSYELQEFPIAHNGIFGH